jgi:DUF971 family protein
VPEIIQPDEIPAAIDSDSSREVLEVTWEDGSITSIPWSRLRRACPCASCAGEFTEISSVADNLTGDQIKIADIIMAGHYAIQPIWADGHATGFYPWKYLRGLGDGSSQ